MDYSNWVLRDVLQICGLNGEEETLEGRVPCRHGGNEKFYCGSHCPILVKARELSGAVKGVE